MIIKQATQKRITDKKKEKKTRDEYQYFRDIYGI